MDLELRLNLFVEGVFVERVLKEFSNFLERIDAFSGELILESGFFWGALGMLEESSALARGLVVISGVGVDLWVDLWGVVRSASARGLVVGSGLGEALATASHLGVVEDLGSVVGCVGSVVGCVGRCLEECF